MERTVWEKKNSQSRDQWGYHRWCVFPVKPTFNSFAGHVKNGELIEAVNAELQQNQNKQAFTCVDIAAVLKDKTGYLNPEYTNDRLHLNGAGYRVWAAAIRKLVK